MATTQWQYRLNALFIIILGLVLVGAFIYQTIRNESPCPLCLLQRLGMLGITMGCMMNIKFGINMAHYGLMLFSACFGGLVSLRQIGLHVCPQFATFGEPVMGFDLYAWALFVFAASIAATSLLLYMYGLNHDHHQAKPRSSPLYQITFVFLFLVVLAEVLTVFNLCGLSACVG